MTKLALINLQLRRNKHRIHLRRGETPGYPLGDNVKTALSHTRGLRHRPRIDGVSFLPI